jgi:hypothetical protein
MTFSEPAAKVKRLEFTTEYMDLHLEDGRLLRIPLGWYPRLELATPKQRKNYELIFDGEAIEWPEIDESVSVAGLLRGNKAPRTKAYLTGKFSDKIERERKRIEALYKEKKSLPSKRSAAPARRTKSAR